MGNKLGNALYTIIPYVGVFLMGVFWNTPWGLPKIQVYVAGPLVIALSAWIRHTRRKTDELGV